MRVGLLIYGSLDARSGGFEYDRRLVEHLRRSEDQVRIIALPWRTYPALLAQNLTAVRSCAAAGRLDLLLQDELNHPSLFLANAYLKKRIGCPVVGIVHHLRCREPHPALLRSVYRCVERKYLRSMDAFVFNSNATRRSVAELIGALPPSLTATPGGDRFGTVAAEDEIVSRARSDGPLRLLFVGNLLPRKGLTELLAALAAIADAAWHLDVVGSGEIDAAYTAGIRRRIAESGLAAKVRLRGAMADKELEKLMRTCHLLAMPFAYEGFGIVFLEAAAFGLPSLVLDRGGAPEVIRNNREGYSFNSGDIAGVAARVLDLIRDRDELVRLGLNARRRFDAFSGWDRTVRKIRRFLLELHSAPVS